MNTSPNFRSTLLCDLHRAVVRTRPLVASLINAVHRQSSGRLIRIARYNPLRGYSSLHERSLSMSGPGGFLPRCFPGLFPQSIQDSLAEKTDRIPCFVRIRGNRTRICFSRHPVSVERKAPFSNLVLRLVRFLVAVHRINPMAGVSQHVGNIEHKRGIQSQAKNGRIDHV
jgi:hypothetical protein